jgi:hypothetical protein
MAELIVASDNEILLGRIKLLQTLQKKEPTSSSYSAIRVNISQ